MVVVVLVEVAVDVVVVVLLSGVVWRCLTLTLVIGLTRLFMDGSLKWRTILIILGDCICLVSISFLFKTVLIVLGTTQIKCTSLHNCPRITSKIILWLIIFVKTIFTMRNLLSVIISSLLKLDLLLSTSSQILSSQFHLIRNFILGNTSLPVLALFLKTGISIINLQTICLLITGTYSMTIRATHSYLGPLLSAFGPISTYGRCHLFFFAFYCCFGSLKGVAYSVGWCGVAWRDHGRILVLQPNLKVLIFSFIGCLMVR